MIREEQIDGFTLLTLDHGKVNAIDQDLVVALRDTFRRLDADESSQGVILTGRPNAFSAGLNVGMLAKSSAEQMVEFWVTYAEALQAMVMYHKPFVCAITGYAPAGATILTLCADYRIMAQGQKHVVGMHEFKMSLMIPRTLCKVYAYQLREANAWRAVQEAKLYNSDEAVKAGLVDVSAPTEDVLPLAKKHLMKLLEVHPKVFAKSKAYLREDLRKLFDFDFEEEAKEFVSFVSQPDIAARVLAFAKALGK